MGVNTLIYDWTTSSQRSCPRWNTREGASDGITSRGRVVLADAKPIGSSQAYEIRVTLKGGAYGHWLGCQVKNNGSGATTICELPLSRIRWRRVAWQLPKLSLHMPIRFGLALTLLLPSLTLCQGTAVAYKSQTGQTMSLFSWRGRKHVVLTRHANRDPRVMKRLVMGLDKAYRVYEQVTRSDPVSNSQGKLDGLDIVAEVPDAETETVCNGAACSYLGSFGSEIGTTYFDQLYNGIETRGEYDQVMFYEFGRSFWFYQEQLGTVDAFVTGFAIANRFVSLDRAGLRGGPFGELSYAEFRKSILIDLLKNYSANPDLTWRNTLLGGQAPPNEHGWDARDLAGAMIYRIYRDSGFAGYRAFWKYLKRQYIGQTPQDAVRNFLMAAKSANGRDYGFLFKDSSLEHALDSEKSLSVGYHFKFSDNIIVSSNRTPFRRTRIRSDVPVTFQLAAFSDFLAF
jgi:hypothetical protein